MRNLVRSGVSALLALMVASPSLAQTTPRGSAAPAIQALVAETGATDVSVNPATGTVRFVRVRSIQGANAAAPVARAAARTDDVETKHGRALDFLRRHAQAFGLSSPDAELSRVAAAVDVYGATHLTYAQQHQGLAVFGAQVRMHFEPNGELAVVNGTLVPDAAAVPTAPTRSVEDAGRAALAFVAGASPRVGLAVRGDRLLIYREGLAGASAEPRISRTRWRWATAPTCASSSTSSALTGKVIDRISGVHEDLTRRAYDGAFLPNVPPSYPASPFWVEGDAFPTASTEANNMLLASNETYDCSSGPRSAAIPSTGWARRWTRSSTAGTSVRTHRGTDYSFPSAPGSPPTTSPRTSGATPTPSTRTISSTPGSRGL